MTVVARVSNLFVTAAGRPILSDIALEIRAGEVLAVLGPNGAGKSTLLRTIAGEDRRARGQVLLNDRPVRDWSVAERALQRAVLSQAPLAPPGFTVEELVLLGRHPHRHASDRQRDRRITEAAMQATRIDGLRGRDCAGLSGGEQLRAHLARVLAQIWEPPGTGLRRLLLLDEPTASLDLQHQHLVLAHARAMAASGVAVLAILHDLNLAAAYADRIAILRDGRLEACGTPDAVLDAARVERVWGMPCRVDRDRDGTLRILVQPLRGDAVPDARAVGTPIVA